MIAKKLFIIFTFLAGNLYAQEISEITFNKAQTHFFFIKNQDSLFVKSAIQTSKPQFITKGCNVETNATFRRWIQNDKKILVQKRDGLYVFELKSKTLHKILFQEKLSYFFFVYLNQIADFGDYLFFASKEQQDMYFSLYRLNLETYQLTKLRSVKKNHIANIAISKDGKLLAYSYFDIASLYATSGLHVLDVKSNQLIYQQKIKDSSFFYGLEFNTNKDLLYRDLVGDNYIVKHIVSQSQTESTTYPVKKYGYFTKFLDNETVLSVNLTEDHRSYKVLNTKKHNTTALINGANLKIKSIRKNGKVYSIFATNENGKTPIQLHQTVVNPKTNVTTKKTIFSPSDKNPYQKTHYSIEAYTNAGNGTSNAYLYLPENYKNFPTKIPMILMVYGCYKDQYPSASYFMDTIVLNYVNHGYAVARLNTRGMCDEYVYDGYGKTQLKDTETFITQISKKYPIDATKVIVAGHSHGATMVYYYLTHSNSFAAGVAFNGAADWIQQAHKRSMTGLPQEMSGTPDELPNKYKQYSPIENINANMKPMFIVSGSNDTQIPDSFNSRAFVEKAQTLNLPIEYLHFKDEGHLFLQEKNLIKIREKLASFLQDILF